MVGSSKTFRKALDAICRTLPGAEVSDPWGGGHDAWKVGGKMFACSGAMQPGVAVKTPDIETATMLIDAGVGCLKIEGRLKTPEYVAAVLPDEMRHRVLSSYDIVRSGLTKKFQATLPERPA